jgi:stage V sporulation protein R
MRLIDQRNKKIMEECKARSRAEGLVCESETLEFITTNQDLIELNPKIMIPTLYDHWIHDVDVVRNRWVYSVYPHNPFETVINTRPSISFYNSDNADWFNIMIFYHVLGHIDVFQSNIFFRNTWGRDFCGEALADKRLINRIRQEMGAEKRWVDYVIEFARNLDNLVGYYKELEDWDKVRTKSVLGVFSARVDFYFGEFLRKRCEEKITTLKFYHSELERYNICQKQFGEKRGEDAFFDDADFKSKFPEFNSVFKKRKQGKKKKSNDILQYLINNSKFINDDDNKWMKDILEVVRRTSLYFQAQIRTKNSHEGWASLWHERLFITDPRISSHEVDFASINAKVVVDYKIGLNPYIGFKRLYEFIEEMGRKGRFSYEYQLLKDGEERNRFDKNLGEEAGKKVMFDARRNFDDFMLVNFLSDDDFQDFVNRHKLFVVGQHLDLDRGTMQYFIKSRNGKDYRRILNDSLYHPPHILISEDKLKAGDEIYLDHVFEGRTLHTEYIPAVLRGLSYLADGTVKLETTEFEIDEREQLEALFDPAYKPEYIVRRVLYSCKGKEVRRKLLNSKEVRNE